MKGSKKQFVQNYTSVGVILGDRGCVGVSVELDFEEGLLDAGHIGGSSISVHGALSLFWFLLFGSSERSDVESECAGVVESIDSEIVACEIERLSEQIVEITGISCLIGFSNEASSILLSLVE